MKGTKVASRYAKALLDLAVEQKKVDSVLGDMHFLLQTNNDAREFELLIASPIIDAEKKIANSGSNFLISILMAIHSPQLYL